MSRDALIAEGRARLRAGDADAGLSSLREAIERHAEDGAAWLEYAGAFDHLGREAEAVAPHERARALGLSTADECCWFVQYGSTLRNLGRHDEALTVLGEGCERSARHPTIRLFRALALHDLGRHDEALAEAIGGAGDLADPHRLDGYAGVLQEYARALSSEPLTPALSPEMRGSNA